MVRNVPFDVINTWPTPNYTNPETRGNISFITINTIALALTVGAVYARLHTRLFINRWLGTVGYDSRIL
jgi:hypothetical protein